jgi:polyisoprenoid-binding protein YceI
MPSYYKDGDWYAVDPARSGARFHLHAMGVPVLRGTLPLSGGELVIDTDGGIRTANFQLDATGITFEAPIDQRTTRGLLGTASHPVIEFETQWARAVGPSLHELDGVLRLHGHEHLFTLRAERGAWEGLANDSRWYRGLVSGGLDRNAWELRSHGLAHGALLLLGHEVHFEVALCARPRATSQPATAQTHRLPEDRSASDETDQPR